jgi:hypothetical protein
MYLPLFRGTRGTPYHGTTLWGWDQSSPIQVEEFHTKYSVLRPEYLDKSLGFSAGSPRTVIKDSCGQYSTFFQQQGLAISYDIFIFSNCSTP